MTRHIRAFHKYILDSKRKPLAVRSPGLWARWLNDPANSTVSKDQIDDGCGGYVLVSTVFLGIDLSLGRVHPPQLFESRVFGGWHDAEMRRYGSWADAVAGHDELVAMCREAIEHAAFLARESTLRHRQLLQLKNGLAK